VSDPTTQIDERRQNLAAGLMVAMTFCTRLPLGTVAVADAHALSRASWALPIAGAMVGGLGALAYWLALMLHVGSWPAAAVALAVTMLLTGCLHEDGLADTADGFGGGVSRERKLAIMRDSRIGTFGACALLVSFALRWSALASIAVPLQGVLALLAAHVSARALLPAFMRFVGPARTDGLSAQAGRPSVTSAAAAGLIAVVVLAASFGPAGTIVALVLLTIAAVSIGWLSSRQIGGQTGDVLGALEQIGEIVVLLTAAGLQHG